MGSRVVGFRVPDDLAEELERESGERGQTTAEFLRKLVDDALYPSKGSHAATLEDVATKAELQNEVVSLDEDVNNLTESFNGLTERLDKNTQLTAVLSDKVDKFSKQSVDLRETYRGQANIVNEHIATFNSNTNVVVSRIDKVQKMVEGLGEGLNEIRTKQASHSHDGVSLIPKLDSKLQSLGTKIAELEATVKNAKKRVPVTPYKFRKLKLSNGTEHTYTLYRGPWGLSRPQKIEDDEYIDLAEPED